MTDNSELVEMLNGVFMLSSWANVFGALTLLALVTTGVIVDPGHSVPIIAIVIAGVMLAQGIYSAGYEAGWWAAWRRAAAGALLAGQLISLCLGLATIAYAIFYVPRASNGGVEPGPFFSGALITANAALAVVTLAVTGVLTPRTRGNART